jgi:hypothetical protein
VDLVAGVPTNSNGQPAGVEVDVRVQDRQQNSLGSRAWRVATVKLGCRGLFPIAYQVRTECAASSRVLWMAGLLSVCCGAEPPCADAVAAA